jgi:hypothetical protein
MSKTSDDYRPCIVVFPNGQTRKSNVLYVRMDSKERAIEKLRKDMAAWVSPEDYEALRAEMHR